MKKLILLLIIANLLFASCGTRVKDESSLPNTSSLENSSETTSENPAVTSSNVETDSSELDVSDTPREVAFEDVKEDLVGGYFLQEVGIYSYNYLFFENGDYIIIRPIAEERYTNENSTIKYFQKKGAYGKEIIIELTNKNNGKKFEFYVSENVINYEGAPLGAVKMPDIVHYGTTGNDPSKLADFRFEDFKDIECGKSNYEDIWQVLLTVLKAQVKDLPNTTLVLRVYVSPIGDITDFPTADGKYIRITYDEGLIVKSIEVVDELCEVYF